MTAVEIRLANSLAFPNHGYADGMTLREWLAGQALTGWLAGRQDRIQADGQVAAEMAMKAADALIRRLAAETPSTTA